MSFCLSLCLFFWFGTTFEHRLEVQCLVKLHHLEVLLPYHTPWPFFKPSCSVEYVFLQHKGKKSFPVIVVFTDPTFHTHTNIFISYKWQSCVQNWRQIIITLRSKLEPDHDLIHWTSQFKEQQSGKNDNMFDFQMLLAQCILCTHPWLSFLWQQNPSFNRLSVRSQIIAFLCVWYNLSFF